MFQRPLPDGPQTTHSCRYMEQGKRYRRDPQMTLAMQISVGLPRVLKRGNV